MKRLIIVLVSFFVIIIAGAATVWALHMFDKKAPAQVTGSIPEASDLITTRVVEGLDHPWDVDFLPDSTMIFTERAGTISKSVNGKKVVIETPQDVKANGEGGLTGLAIDPNFTDNRYVYACFNSTKNDIRVARWKMSQNVSTLSERQDIVTGIPSNSSGRHSGCQIAFGPDKNLWVGTGDAADESQPQNQDSLGGKILRVTRDGIAAIGNPDGPDTRVYSYGHRNVQALAFYPSVRNGSYGVSVEHGPDRDDEVNDLKPGNFGWDPGDNYDESAPMTDKTKFPNANASLWSSGNTTIAASGAAILKGDKWNDLNNWLAVTSLKAQKVVLLDLTTGSILSERSVLENKFGRLRAATISPRGDLYLSTDNGSNDAILKVTAN